MRLVPFVRNAAQQDYASKRTGRDLILKARQLGFSTDIQADNFVDVVSKTTLSVTMAHDDPTTQKLRRMAQRFYDHLPLLQRPPRGLDNTTTTTYPQTGSEVTIVTAGSGNAGRGGTYNRVHGSEVAFWKNAELLMAGIMQGVTQDGVIELESTPNGTQGYFYEQCMEALDPTRKSEFTLHFYAWWWDATYATPLERGEDLAPYADDELVLIAKHHLTPEQIKWRRAKQRALGRLFPQEYPEDPVTCFLSSGNGVFGDFSAALYTPFAPTRNPEHHYFGGVDWGQENDYTTCSILDVDDYREVLLLRMNKQRWGNMRREILDACRMWGVETLVVERNSASSNIEDLRDEFETAGLTTTINGFTMTNKKKADLVVNFKHAIQEDDLRLIDEPSANHELRNFVSKQTASGLWTYAAEGNGHDDIVIARMLAQYAVSKRIPEHW